MFNELNQQLNQTICKMFPHRWNWILKKEEQSWRTIKTPLRDESLSKIYSDPKQIVGVGFGKHSQYIMLDIDKNSPYHPHNDRKAIVKLKFALSKIGLEESIIIQSSDSKGIHIYYPLKVKLTSYSLGKKITEYLESEGWTVKNGILEVFPNKKKGSYSHNKEEWTSYQRHRLPLQPDSGSHLLDQNYRIIRQAWQQGIEEFVSKWEQIQEKQPIETLKTHLYGKKSSSKIKTISRELEAQIARGFTNAGETNDILLQLGRKVRIVEKLGGIELRDRLIEIVTSMSGYEEYCSHQEEIETRCQDIARWAEKKFWVKNAKKKEELPLPKTNNKYKEEEARLRIIRTIEEALEQTFKTITEFMTWVVKKAKCSMKTLYKYEGKWRGIVLLEGNRQQATGNSAGVENSEQKIDNTEKNKIVCNKPEEKEQSRLCKNNTEQLEKQLEIKQSKEQSQIEQEKEENRESVEKQPQDKDLSSFNLDQYILRLYILSQIKPQGSAAKEEHGTGEDKCKQSESQNEKVSNEDCKQWESQVSERGKGEQGRENSEARTRFIEELKEKWGELPSKLMKLVLKAEVQQLENCRELLKDSKVRNPIGFIIKALENNWQVNKPKKQRKTEKSWYAEFEEFYHQAVAQGYCLDFAVNHLPTNHNREPMVKVNKPDAFTGASYTVMYWREAMALWQ